uniref:Coiled-coil domain-containing protein 149 n=1 Tax=Phallusia mammillata TaxID=59560 RepID=A0A6F9D999_9ASCI|nr:coiled-coil domain-containing protein 149 [Phallusia mammillata]
MMSAQPVLARRERSHPEWQAMITEYQILKRKLQSKSEALLIISKDLDGARLERDQFKLMAEKLQEKCQAFKRHQADFPLTSDKAKLLVMLKEMKSQKLQYQKQCEHLQLKLNEAVGDVKLLREKFARHTVGDGGIGARHFPLHEREKLVTELEESQQECDHWKKEFLTQGDVLSEAISEKDAMQKKVDRLNQEMSYLLTGDKKRIIDIDALCMENKYLQERITQCQEEKNSLHAQLRKYKAILSSRKASRGDLMKPGLLQSAGLIVSPKQLKDLFSNGTSSPQQVADLQSIISALLETVNDKNLALHHLRNTNKILGNRVSDLEGKLKTLEVAGLWNMHSTGERNVPTEDMSTNLNLEETKDSVKSLLPLQDETVGSSHTSLSADNVKSLNSAQNVTEQTIEENNNNIDCDEFLSSLGSRLSKLTDRHEANSENVYKLISVTPLSSSDGSMVLSTEKLETSSTTSSPCNSCNQGTVELDALSHPQRTSCMVLSGVTQSHEDGTLNDQDEPKSKSESLVL